MNTQQRRLFFKTATTLQGVCRPHRWLAVIMSAVLLCSCSTLTPDRIAVLAALAGNAAQIGVQAWLKEHPEHRDSFEAVARAIAAFLAAQGTPPDARESVVASIMGNLPTSTLRCDVKGSESELYMSGDNLVVWDGKTKKATMVDGKSTEPVLRAVRDGLLRALAPVPPLPVKAPARVVTGVVAWQAQPPQIVYVTNTIITPSQSPYTLELRNGLHTNSLPSPQDVWLEYLKTPPKAAPVQPTNAPAVVQFPTLGTARAKFSKEPRVGIYRVERKDGTNWVEIQSFTSKPAEFRVKRVR